MKNLVFRTMSLAMVATALTPVPALATPIAFSSIPAAQQQAMQTTCDGFIPGNSPFVATPSDLQATVTLNVETNRVTIQNIPGGTLLSQTPYVFTTGSEHKEGQSPNIFGEFSSIATFSGGLNVQEVTYADRYKVTFGCALSKDNGVTYPNGQQVPNDGTLFVNFDLNSHTDTDTVSAPDYTQTVYDNRVICISPTKNPGQWRSQNGYTGTCSTTLYNSVNPGGTHSNSVPSLTPLRPNTDHSDALPLDSLNSSPLPWDGEV